mmetsp:Transcript_33272/g.98974  ORF Transcript_33272/g.98974 Transcript_33272/m.98974 type:complete len:204 (-) Transcript_33272:1445-2056(-)
MRILCAICAITLVTVFLFAAVDSPSSSPSRRVAVSDDRNTPPLGAAPLLTVTPLEEATVESGAGRTPPQPLVAPRWRIDRRLLQRVPRPGPRCGVSVRRRRGRPLLPRGGAGTPHNGRLGHHGPRGAGERLAEFVCLLRDPAVVDVRASRGRRAVVGLRPRTQGGRQRVARAPKPSPRRSSRGGGISPVAILVVVIEWVVAAS